MIDIHTHLLPGVDDGSQSVEASLAVLAGFAAGGVDIVVCSPHLSASQATEAPFEHHTAIFDQLVAAAPPMPKLLLGWEIMLDAPGVELSDQRFALGGSNAVLVEFGHVMIPPNSTAELFRLRMSGVVPIVAHPERYSNCTVALVREWRNAGAVMQMGVDAVVGARRHLPFGQELLADGLIDLLASDTHADGRSLVPVRQWLNENGTREHAHLLTQENARRLLNGESTLPVPPLVRKPGMLGRLGELLRGGRNRLEAR